MPDTDCTLHGYVIYDIRSVYFNYCLDFFLQGPKGMPCGRTDHAAMLTEPGMRKLGKGLYTMAAYIIQEGRLTSRLNTITLT